MRVKGRGMGESSGWRGDPHLKRKPRLPCGHVVDIELVPVLGNVILEHAVDVVEVFLKLPLPFLLHLAERGHRPLVLHGCEGRTSNHASVQAAK